MAISFFQMAFAGQASVAPQRGCLVCTNTLAQVTAAGFLSNSPSSPVDQQVFNGDFIFVVYNNGSGGIASALFVASITGGVITLAAPANEGVPSYIEGITLGISAANKAVVLDSSSKIDGVSLSAIETAGTYVAALTATTAEANLNHLQLASVTTVSTTPGTGSCAAQFQFKNAAGTNIAVVTPFLLYVCTSAGNLSTAATSIAALTNGQLTELVIGQVDMGTTNVTGQIGITLTATAGTYYVAFILPNGQYAVSSALVCN